METMQIAVDNCPGCGVEMPHAVDDHAYLWGCEECAAKYPASLIKATFDLFDYALGLTTGEVIYFESADIRGEWVRIHVKPDPWTDKPGTPWPYTFDRGIDIRIANIAWCADAPYGS